MRLLTKALLSLAALPAFLWGDNQTPDTTPILPGNLLPFKIRIEQANFSLPSGIQSYASANYKGKIIILAGRSNGLHGFDNNDTNFPPNKQNTDLFIIDPKKSSVIVKSLKDPSSGLTQEQIDTLSVTSPQSYQSGKYLYMAGGYGVDTATGLFNTKDTFTAIDLKGLIHWAITPSAGETAAKHILQIRDPIFQITGGYMDKTVHNLTLLIFGQNFQGFYTDSTNGLYSQQVRRFHIHNHGDKLSVEVKSSTPNPPNAFFRRRDLNVVPVMQKFYGLPLPGYVALSGVFTESSGIWTVPVFISTKGYASMEDQNKPTAFKQGMNNYACPTVGMFSEKHGDMFVVLLGGISYGYYDNGIFKTDSEIPFINQVTTVKLDKEGIYSQYLMDGEYPFIASTGTNPGNKLLFGAGADFFPRKLSTYPNGVIKYDHLPKRPKLLGYIVGGIMSTLPNTVTRLDSAASPYIFKVFLDPI